MGELKVKIQKFGAFLSGMVMPNIGAFIAWGILTALFIPAGWFPNETMNKLVSPTLTYLCQYCLVIPAVKWFTISSGVWRALQQWV